MIKNKQGGFEMSVTTLVVIVIAVVMLILGLVFVRQIFKTATESMTVMDSQIKTKLNKMFEEEGYPVAVLTKVVTVKRGTEAFSIPIAFQTQSGEGAVDVSLEYKVELKGGDCIGTENWIISPELERKSKDFSTVVADKAYLDIVLSVPKTVAKCRQIIKISVYEPDYGESYDTFTLNIA